MILLLFQEAEVISAPVSLEEMTSRECKNESGKYIEQYKNRLRIKLNLIIVAIHERKARHQFGRCVF